MSRSLTLQLRVTTVLVGLCVLGSLSTLPLLIAARANAGEAYADSTSALIGLAVLQTLVLFGIAAFLGLRAAAASGLPGAPLILGTVGGPVTALPARPLAISAGLGMAAGVMIVATDLALFQNESIRVSTPAFDRTFGLNLLTGVLYGGINEEVFMRLFLVSSIIYLLSRTLGRSNPPAPWVIWTAIVVAALVFGVSHLPFTSLLTAITPQIILRAVLLNGIVGILCGRLYILFGIEAAMVAHAAAHVPLQVAASAFHP